MKPFILISVALAGGVASAQFVTSVTQAQPAVSDVAALELRQAGTTTTTTDQETTTTKKTTSTTSAKTTTTTSKPTTTATTTGTTKTTSRTTTATGQTTTTHSTSTTTGQTSAPGQTDKGTTDTATSTSATGSDVATDAPGSGNQNDGTGNNNTTTQSKGLSAGAAAGIAVGAVLGALAIAGAAFFFWRRRRGGVRGAIVTADRPEMSDPFGRHGPEPTLPVVTPSPGPSHPSPGPSQAYSVSAPSESSTAYSNNANHNWGPGAGAAGYAQPPRGNGYRPLSFEESPESVATYGHNSYQRLLPAEEVPHQPQSHDRYERLGQEEAGEIHSPGVGHYDSAALDERHSNLPAFMIPGGARKPSLPGGQPVPKIEVQTATPIAAGRRPVLPSQGRGRVELPG